MPLCVQGGGGLLGRVCSCLGPGGSSLGLGISFLGLNSSPLGLLDSSSLGLGVSSLGPVSSPCLVILGLVALYAYFSSSSVWLSYLDQPMTAASRQALASSSAAHWRAAAAQ